MVGYDETNSFSQSWWGCPEVRCLPPSEEVSLDVVLRTRQERWFHTGMFPRLLCITSSSSDHCDYINPQTNATPCLNFCFIEKNHIVTQRDLALGLSNSFDDHRTRLLKRHHPIVRRRLTSQRSRSKAFVGKDLEAMLLKALAKRRDPAMEGIT